MIVQIAATEVQAKDEEVIGTLYALSDEGSIWMMVNPWSDNAKWVRLLVKGGLPNGE
jgi:hypothetical protein